MIQYHIDQVDNPQLIESIDQIKYNIINNFLFLTCNCDESNKGILGVSLCLTSKGISKNIQNNNYSKKSIIVPVQPRITPSTCSSLNKRWIEFI